MTEPVAYWHIPQLEDYEVSVGFDHSDSRIFENIPLYTDEQLHPRVKMTQAERVEFNKLLLSSAVTIYEAIDTIYKDNGKMNEFSHLYQRLFNRNDKLELENQLEFSKLWANFNIENPEETIEIEIVPDMKWFVRSKELNLENNYYYFVGKRPQDLFILYGYKKAAKHFDTKEEAEKWTNPLTEAVQLPVEDK